MDEVIIDGARHKLGRLASHVAKLSLEGNKVIILNCEKIAITGKKGSVLKEKVEKVLNIRGRHKGPHWPRRPDNIVRRTIRGMLPMNKEIGKNALKRIEVYIGVPKEFEGKDMIKFKKALLPENETRFIFIKDLSKALGGRWYD